MFDSGSRYYTLENVMYDYPNGHRVTYKRRRILAQGAEMPLLTEVTTVQGDRLDLIAARTLGVPDQFWRICDASNALNPFDLTDQPGTIVRVPIPQFQDQ